MKHKVDLREVRAKATSNVDKVQGGVAGMFSLEKVWRGGHCTLHSLCRTLLPSALTLLAIWLVAWLLGWQLRDKLEREEAEGKAILLVGKAYDECKNQQSLPPCGNQASHLTLNPTLCVCAQHWSQAGQVGLGAAVSQVRHRRR